MHPLRPWSPLFLLAALACTGDGTTDVTDATDVTDTPDPTGDSGTTELAGLDVTIQVSGSLPGNRVAVLRGTADKSGFTQDEVVADLAVAATVETRIPEPEATAIYVFVLYDDADADEVFDGDVLHGASTMTRSWTPTDGWVANEFFADVKPAVLELDSAVVLDSRHGLAPDIEATVAVSKISNPERLTTVSGFGDVTDRSGAVIDVAITGKTATGTPATPDASRFRAPDGLPLVLEHLIAIDDADDSGSFNDGDPLAAWVCSGSDLVSLVYVTPVTDPGLAFAHAMFDVPNGWRAITGFGPGGQLIELEASEAKALVVSDTACGF